jgi:hypothetical protein
VAVADRPSRPLTDNRLIRSDPTVASRGQGRKPE